MKTLLVGLGNPNYAWTPHNIGSDLLNLCFPFQLEDVYLLREPDYMNISGPVIVKFITKNQIKKLIVLVDDIDTKVGKVVVSFGTSHRGHNGIRSIIESYGKNFWKIRIGVGRQEDTNFLLTKIKDINPYLELVPILREKIFNLLLIK